MSELEKAFLRSPNAFRGLAIIIIVMAHILFMSDRQSEEGMPVFIQALYLGLMGFFIISGYFYRPGKGFKRNFLKRFRQIAIPVVLAAAILPLMLFTYLNILGYGLPIDDLIDSIVWEIGFGNAFMPIGHEAQSTSLSLIAFGSYYLITMIWAFLFFYAVADRVLDDLKKTVFAIIFILTAAVIAMFLIPIRIPTFPFLGLVGAAFMLLGACLAKHDYIETMESKDKNRTFYLFPLLGLIAGMGMCYILPPGTGFDMSVFGDYGSVSIYPYFIEGTLMFLPLIFLSYILTKIPLLFPMLSKIGKHTIAILLLHPVIVKAIIAPFYQVESIFIMPAEVPMMIKLTVGAVTIALCVIIAHLLEKFLPVLKERFSL